MCGLAGIYRYKSGKLVDEKEIEKMCNEITYRGPDDYGLYVEGQLGLGHRRLSIIDTSSRSKQPMMDIDESVIIIFNGEVYNYIELRKDLENEGYKFKTSSDTEVIIQMYRKYGERCLDFFNGMFSFAIWDIIKKKLFIARDRLGIKPLYYFYDCEGIIFASEIKSILTVLSHKPKVNIEMLDLYMGVGYTPTENTLFKDIKKLRPGHYLIIDKGGEKIVQYWDLKYQSEKDKGEQFYIEKTINIFQDAVKLRLRSDVPLGVFLSGGLDSSAVVAIMHKMGIRNIKTFSVAWDFGDKFNETKYARRVSSLFKTEHYEYFITGKDFCDFIESYIWHMDEPVTESAAISLYHIAKLAKEHVTVILSGEGSDEVFGGYTIYKYMKILEYYRYVAPNIRNKILNRLLNCFGPKMQKYTSLSELPIEKRYHGVSFCEDSHIKDLLYTDYIIDKIRNHKISDVLSEFYDKTKGMDILKRMQYLDIKTWLVDDLLIKADRMSMAPSLELRVPFLDHRMLEYAVNIPAKYRIKNGITKYIIRKAMIDYLPKDIVYRKKMGFPTPLEILFRGELLPYIKDILNSKRFNDRGYFKKDVVQRMINEHCERRRDHHRILWQLIVLEEWHRKFVD